VGVDAKLETFEWGAYLAQLRKPREESRHEMYLIAWAPSTGEARWGIYPISACDQWRPKGSNDSFYCNKQLDEMIDKAVASRTAKERDGYMRKAQEILVEDPSAIYLLATKETVGMSMKLHGIINSPLELVYADKDTWMER
jgi:ABC-type transport system substrate-binding protein